MPATAWPSVIAAVLTTAEAAVAPTRVVRGTDVTNEESDVVMVGTDSADPDGPSRAGGFEQTMQSFGGPREEIGTVNGVAFARDGDGDQAVSSEAACGYIATLAAAVRADPTLGLTAFDYVITEFSAGDVSEMQDEDEGAITAVSFVIAYKIRLT